MSRAVRQQPALTKMLLAAQRRQKWHQRGPSPLAWPRGGGASGPERSARVACNARPPPKHAVAVPPPRPTRPLTNLPLILTYPSSYQLTTYSNLPTHKLTDLLRRRTNAQAEHEALQDRMDELLSLFRSLAPPPAVALPAPQPLQLEQLEQLHQLRTSLDSGLRALNQRIDAMDLAHLVQVQAQAQMGTMAQATATATATAPAPTTATATATAPAPGSLYDDGAGGAVPKPGAGAAASPASPAPASLAGAAAAPDAAAAAAAACPWREKASGRCAASPPRCPCAARVRTASAPCRTVPGRWEV